MTSETSLSAMGRMRTSGTASSSSGAVAIGICVALGCGECLEYATCELQVLPRLALIAGGSQEVSRMIRHNQRRIKLTEVVDLASQTAQGSVRCQQVLRRDPSDRKHDTGLQQFD